MSDEGRGEPETAPDTRIEEAAEADAGRRVDRFLAERLEVSRAQVRRILERGLVSQAGRPLAPSDKGRTLDPGDALEIRDFRPEHEQRIRPEGASAGAVEAVLGEGEGWIAFDKRAGAPVHPLREEEGGSVLNAAVALRPELQGVGEGGLRSGVVHRLDVDTSGALLVASEQACWERLRRAFREHRVDKIYRAIVLGRMDEEMALEVGLVVARHRPARVRVVPLEGADDAPGVWRASQRIRPLEALDGLTLIEVRPRTGFLHQIRATLAWLGHPLAGDAAYLGDARDPSGARRHQLHASRLGFEEIAVESPDPEDFLAVLEANRR